MEIGIIGQGFVGSAIRAGLENYYRINTYDVKTELASCETLLDVVVRSQIVFVCLPTPMNPDGSCDTSLVRSVVSEVDQACFTSNLTGRIVVIKSTVPPGTTADLDAQCSNISMIFSPEFLTEANSFDDFKNQTRIILGGRRPGTSIVKTMLKKAFPKIPIIKTGSRTAEFVKYFTNCFLATKVSFANEMKQICDEIDVDFDKVVEYALYDDRIGKSHLSVPGPDGNLGFGGHCVKGDIKIKTNHGPVSFNVLYERYINNELSGTTILSTNYSLSEKEEKKVSNVTKNHYSGRMITLTFGDNTFECTENHLIAVRRNNINLLLEAKHITLDDEIFVMSR